jgi:hypothetical protein
MVDKMRTRAESFSNSNSRYKSIKAHTMEVFSKPIRPAFQTIELLAWSRRFHVWSIRLLLLSYYWLDNESRRNGLRRNLAWDGNPPSISAPVSFFSTLQSSTGSQALQLHLLWTHLSFLVEGNKVEDLSTAKGFLPRIVVGFGNYSAENSPQ